jgi:hypothetical protein
LPIGLVPGRPRWSAAYRFALCGAANRWLMMIGR